MVETYPTDIRACPEIACIDHLLVKKELNYSCFANGVNYPLRTNCVLEGSRVSTGTHFPSGSCTRTERKPTPEGRAGGAQRGSAPCSGNVAETLHDHKS